MNEPLQFSDEQKVAGDTRWIMRSEWCQSVQVYRSANLSVSDATPTIPGFDSEDHDTNNLHDTVTNNSRLTCVVKGIYEITACAVWQSSAVGHRIIRINKNGGASIRDGVTDGIATGDPTYHLVTTKNRMAVGDYVEKEVEQSSGGPLDLLGGAANSYFSMVRVA